MNDIESAIERFKEILRYGNTEILYPNDCTLAIQALQAQAERDKMRCENCIYASPFEYTANPFLCNYRALPIRVDGNNFCNHFESKGVKNNGKD